MNDWWHWIVLFRLNRKESFEKYGFHVDRSSLFILRFYASLTPGDTMVSLISPTPSLCHPPSPRYKILVPNDTYSFDSQEMNLGLVFLVYFSRRYLSIKFDSWTLWFMHCLCIVKYKKFNKSMIDYNYLLLKLLNAINYLWIIYLLFARNT